MIHLLPLKISRPHLNVERIMLDRASEFPVTGPVVEWDTKLEICM